LNIRDVAQRAGVSVATVSRVLNHPDQVTPKTRERILEIMKAMDYTPNWFARGLNLNRTGVIALLIPNIMNPIYTEIAKGVEEVAHNKGYYTLLCNSEDSKEKEAAYIEMLLHRKVDGLIFIAGHLDPNLMKRIEETRLPAVMIGKIEGNWQFSAVYTDYFEGARKATAHLIENGYSGIAHITGNLRFIESAEKLNGYREALNNANIEINPKWIIGGEETIEGGYLAAKRLVRNPNPPEAIFIANDWMAFGAIDAIKTEGFRIPEDIAIVGFDNNRMSGLVEPKLTTVNLPVYKMGLTASRLLFDEMDTLPSTSESDEKTDQKQQIFLPLTIKVRHSCGHQDRIKAIFGE